MRKILSFMVFMILIGVPELWAEPVYIDPPNQTVGVGDTIDIDVAISGVTDLRGHQFSIEYDPSILELVSVSNGPFLGSGWSTPDITMDISTPGLVLHAGVVRLGESSGPSGSGVLADVQFRAIASGTSQINLFEVLLASGGNFEQVPAEISNGNVTVTGGGQENQYPMINTGPTATPNPLYENQTATVMVTATDGDNDPLTYTWSATGGAISGKGATVTYTPPNVDVQTAHTVTVLVSDGKGGTATGSVHIIVKPVILPNVTIISPLNGATVTVGGTVAIEAHATDNPNHVQFYIDSLSKMTDYTAPYQYTWDTTGYANTSHSIYVSAYYSSLNQNITSSTVTVTVNNLSNLPPVIEVGPTATPNPVDESQTATVMVTATDGDADPMTYSWSATGGTISGKGATVTYRPPDVDVQMTYAITVVVSDGKGGTDTGYTSILVNPVAEPIVSIISPAPNATVSGIVTIEVQASGNPDKVYFYIDGISRTVDTTAPYQYTWDTISYSNATSHSIYASAYYSSIATHYIKSPTITVFVNNAINQAPTANDQEGVYTYGNTPKPILLTGSDPDEDSLTYTIVSEPMHGGLSGTAPNVIYTPDTGYTGTDSFRFKVNDGISDSNIAEVSIAIAVQGGARIIGPYGELHFGDNLPITHNSIPPTKRLSLEVVDLPTGFELYRADLKLGSDISVNGTVDANGYIKDGNHLIRQYVRDGTISVILDARYIIGQTCNLECTFTASDGRVVESTVLGLKVTDPLNDPWPAGAGFGIVHNGTILKPGSLLYGQYKYEGRDTVAFEIGGFNAEFEGKFEIELRGKGNIEDTWIEGTITNGSVTITDNSVGGGNRVTFDRAENTLGVTLWVDYRGSPWHTGMDGAEIYTYFKPSNPAEDRGCIFRSGWLEGLTFISPQGIKVNLNDVNGDFIRQNFSITADSSHRVRLAVSGIPSTSGDFDWIRFDIWRGSSLIRFIPISVVSGTVPRSKIFTYDFSALLNDNNQWPNVEFEYQWESSDNAYDVEGEFKNITLLRQTPLAIITDYPPPVTESRDASFTAASTVGAQYAWKKDTEAYSAWSGSTDMAFSLLPPGEHSVRMKMLVGSNQYESDEVRWQIVPSGDAFDFSLSLPPYWNMISIPIVPSSTDLPSVLASIDGKYTSVWAYDALYQRWELYAVGMSLISDLSTVEPGTGYWIMMTEPATLNLNGTGITAPGIQLYKGWNLVGYNSHAPRDVQGAMSSINGIYKSVWTYEPISGGWLYYIVGVPDFLNSLTQLEPGRSYWIEVDSDCVWDVQ